MVRVRALKILAALALILAAMPGSHAALDFRGMSEVPSDVELVVVEVDGCIYCSLFRRDVWPTYAKSMRAKTVPMRFVDLNDTSIEAFKLEAPIDSVPTVLVLQSQKEVGRVAGYVGPEVFFHSLDRMLAGGP